MQLVLAWKVNQSSLPPENVIRNLQTLYIDLFQSWPTIQTRIGQDYCLVYLEQSPSGWKAQYYESDNANWALSLDFPFNIRSVCANAWKTETGQSMLLPLSRALSQNPAEALSRLSPHFALFWGDQQGTELTIQIDGLGFCQLFEFQSGDNWAVSNKISAFKALGHDIRPSASDFAVKFALKGFPNQLSGFHNIRQFSPGQRSVVNQGGVRTEHIDVLGSWVRDQELDRNECLELGRLSVLEELKAVNDLCEKPIWAALTGGRDTRALVSTLLKGGFDFQLRVRGRDNSYDVRIAKKLAGLVDKTLSVEEDAVLPPSNAQSLLHKARLAVLWQGGHQSPNLIKMFLSGRDRLDAGFTNFMGQHGEIGRGMYEIFLKLTPPSLTDKQNEDLLFTLFAGKRLDLLQTEHRERARAEFSLAYNKRADQYDLHGWRRLNFFVLNQHTRRYNSGGHYAQPGQVVTPFLNVDFIRACYSFPVEELRFHPFHDYMVKHNCSPWASIEYDQEIIARDAQRRMTMLGQIKRSLVYYLSQFTSGRSGWARPYQGDDFIPWRYWKSVGASAIEDILQRDGLWNEIFKPQTVLADWSTIADELLLLKVLNEIYSS